MTLSDGRPILIPGHFSLINAGIVIVSRARSLNSLILNNLGSDLFLKLIETFGKLFGLMFDRLQLLLDAAEMHGALVYGGLSDWDGHWFGAWRRLFEFVFLSLFLFCLLF